MSQKVPFLDLSRIHKDISEPYFQKIHEIIEKSSFVLGPAVSEFEKDFAAFTGTKYAVGVGSGLDALKLALRALGVQPGDEVLVPANTFIATAFAVSHIGAKPVFVDVNYETKNLDPKQLQKHLTKKTKAIMPVHLYGLSAAMNEINAFAKENKLAVVEDTAQAHGATYFGKKCGAMSDVGAFSFYPTKNLGSMGEGGAVVLNSPEIKEKIEILRNVGQKEKNIHLEIGYNSRLHSIQAAVLKIKLASLKQHNEQRQKAAKFYQEYLGGVNDVILPSCPNEHTHVYHLYVICVRDEKKRSLLQAHLTESGIGCAVHYPTPVHLQPCYKNLGYKLGDFPVAEKLSREIISIPMFAGLTEAEVQQVAKSIKTFYS